MNRFFLGILSVSTLLACHPKFPVCREDADCTDADNHGLQVHCIDGQCQECRTATDCGAGKTCQSMRCVTAPSSASAPAAPTQPAAGGAVACDFPKIHFDLNASELSAADQQALQQVAQCLLSQPHAHITIEGDCDERGTEEYNLALGARRASNVEKYLDGLGVHRVSTVSYGKDKPVCTQDTEACWRRNRRADFDVARK
jgi:peptidoglycan-associated lipoprotein